MEKDLKSNLENVLSPKELDMVMNSQHKVVKCCSMLSEIALQVRDGMCPVGNSAPGRIKQVVRLCTCAHAGIVFVCNVISTRCFAGCT